MSESESPPGSQSRPKNAMSRRAFLIAGSSAVAVGSAGAGGALYVNHQLDRIGHYSPDRIRKLYGSATSPLLRRYPGLAGKLPWLPLATLPTPVEEWPSPGSGSQLFVKRDDLTSALYGGNKVRKLEHILAEARLADAQTLLTVGGLGSNQCLATTIHGRELGFETDICLFDQPMSDHVVANLLAGAEAGAHMHYGGGIGTTAWRLIAKYRDRKRAGERPYYVPVGATSPLGNIGYVTAALELAEQIHAGQLPMPDRIFVATGSGGTLAGLILGLKLAGLASRCVAVQITESIAVNSLRLRLMARSTLGALRELDPAIGDAQVSAADFDIESRFYGGVYGGPTAESEAAIQWAAPRLELEHTYTAKALAACLAYCRGAGRGQNVLFWNTLNSAPLRQAADRSGLPPAIRRLLPAEGA
jgi:D-cysteine desulfhydrase